MHRLALLHRCLAVSSRHLSVRTNLVVPQISPVQRFSSTTHNFNSSNSGSDRGEPTIPPFIENFHESEQDKRSRLLYQSRKRGILENCLLLGTFASKYLDGFNEEQLTLYDRLINLPSNDWEIYYWATGAKPTPEDFDNEVMNLLKKHAQNEDKESRFKLPDLKSSA